MEHIEKDNKTRYLVIGIYEEALQRYADIFDCGSADEAEELAIASAFGTGDNLVVAGVVALNSTSFDDLEIS